MRQSALPICSTITHNIPPNSPWAGLTRPPSRRASARRMVSDYREPSTEHASSLADARDWVAGSSPAMVRWGRWRPAMVREKAGEDGSWVKQILRKHGTQRQPQTHHGRVKPCHGEGGSGGSPTIPRVRLTVPFLEQIVPLWIDLLDQFELPHPFPTFDIGFAADGVGVQRIFLDKDENSSHCTSCRIANRGLRGGLKCAPEYWRSRRCRACRCACWRECKRNRWA